MQKNHVINGAEKPTLFENVFGVSIMSADESVIRYESRGTIQFRERSPQ